jgi:hypothetical protein
MVGLPEDAGDVSMKSKKASVPDGGPTRDFQLLGGTGVATTTRATSPMTWMANAEIDSTPAPRPSSMLRISSLSSSDTSPLRVQEAFKAAERTMTSMPRVSVREKAYLWTGLELVSASRAPFRAASVASRTASASEMSLK